MGPLQTLGQEELSLAGQRAGGGQKGSAGRAALPSPACPCTRDSTDSGGAISQRRGCYFEKTEGTDISEQQELV